MHVMKTNYPLAIYDRQPFEEWLLAQDPNREYEYTDGDISAKKGCIFCCYLQDKGIKTDFIVGPNYLDIGGINIRLPDWFLALKEIEVDGDTMTTHYTFGPVIKAYKQLFNIP